MFRNARIILTAWYLLIISLICLAFSLVIYRVIGAEVERFARTQRLRIERRWPGGWPPVIIIDQDIVVETKKRLVVILVLVNGGVLGLAGIFGYVLAGRTLAPIGQMIEEQNRFVSDASHEFRTPLTSLKSAFEVYLREKKPTIKEARTVVEESVEEVNKLQSLSDGLLHLARCQWVKNSTSHREVSVKEVIDRAVFRVKKIAEQKEIKITRKSEDVKVWGNPEELADLLVILLDNAIKYSDKGKGVTVAAGEKENKVMVTVADEGIGMTKEEMPHIFDRFYRVDKSRSRNKNGGYGLGLAIAKKIAEANGARIEVESEINKGSTFTVSFQKSKIS